MSRYADYIPTNDGKFLSWVKNLFAYMMAHAIEWNLNPSSWLHIEPMITTYDDALTKAADPNRGKADVRVKNQTRDALKKEMRKYVKGFLEYNPLVTDDDRKRMGLPVHDRKPTPASDPDTLPVATVKTPSPGVFECHFIDSKSGKKAKPAGVHGCEFRWAIADTTPTDWQQLVNSSFSTRTPIRISFEGSYRGKILYFALRWENTRGVKGPWTEIMKTFIP
jgi:hypothetical protein